ncbi:MAG: hypothetical protein WC314_22450 [Vulcanimicrobiota bacterium]
MQNGAANNAKITWERARASDAKHQERWNRPALQNGSSIFWRAVEARRAPRSELEFEFLLQSTPVLSP